VTRPPPSLSRSTLSPSSPSLSSASLPSFCKAVEYRSSQPRNAAWERASRGCDNSTGPNCARLVVRAFPETPHAFLSPGSSTYRMTPFRKSPCPYFFSWFTSFSLSLSLPKFRFLSRQIFYERVTLERINQIGFRITSAKASFFMFLGLTTPYIWIWRSCNNNIVPAYFVPFFSKLQFRSAVLVTRVEFKACKWRF
jgi:hypothetical protein